MQIVLIIPPSIFLLDERVFMNLGILRVAAVLEKAGHTVEVLDLSGVENFLDAVEHHARSTTSTFFGITATTPQLPAAVKIAQKIRETKPGARLILGGPHATLVQAAWKKEVKTGHAGRATQAATQMQALFDVVVAGDGEEAIFKAMTTQSFPCWIDADDPKSSLFLDNDRLNLTPFPARHLVDVESYRYFVDGERAMSMIAQLGCPFACGFCGGRESAMLRRIRTRNVDNVVAEIDHLYQTYGVKGFMLYDDELNVNPQMVPLMNAITDLQMRHGVEFRLRGFIKSQLFTPEQAAAMRRAGFRWMLTGFESGSPRMLKNMNKKATREENTRCMDIARSHDIKVKALMSMGHPGESEETIRETEDWLLQVKPDDFDVTIITTYPGTPYYDQAVRHPDKPNVWIYTFQENGDHLYSYEVDYMKVADYYKGDPNGGYVSYVYTDHLTSEELVAHRDRVERSVRSTLKIPFNPSRPASRYEHSMGQAPLPSFIFRSSSNTTHPGPLVA